MADNDTALTEVEGNPFEDTKLVPVNHNPFADYSVADTARGDPFAMGPAEPYGPSDVPQAFLDRVRRGAALKRIIDRAISTAPEGWSDEPYGISPEHQAQLRNLGIFHNFITGRPGIVGVLGEAAVDATASGLDSIMRMVSAGVHGAGGAFGQLVDELGGGETQRLKAEREAINLGNMLLIDAGMGNYTRPHITRDQIIHMQPIGGLPTEADFRNAANVIAPERLTTPVKADEDLRRLWWERGVLPSDVARNTEFAALAKEPVGHIIAFHGSPHDFDKFDLSKIGTGEGAQAYGHGLYFAESEGVAKSYRDQLADWLTGPSPREAALADPILGPRLKAADIANDWDAQAAIISEARNKYGPGKMYQVNINADPEHFLDWDKPLSEQSEHVRKSLAAARTLNTRFMALGDKVTGHDPSISAIYDRLGMKLFGDAYPNAETATTALKKAGIPGIKYLDQGSRSAGEGSRNYVVFDDQIVQITHKNDVPVENLRDLWQERGIHPAEAAADAQQDAFVREEIAQPGGADVTRPESLPTPEQQPLSAPGSIVATMRSVGDQLWDIGRDIQMNLTPMAAGSRDAMALAKDFANSIRRNRWEWNRVDQWVVNSPELKAARDRLGETAVEQRQRMWEAADEESVAQQLGESTEHQGLVRLEPEERAMIEDLQSRAQMAWAHARDLGTVEGDGLPAYTPRMVLNVAEASGEQRGVPLNVIGRNVSTRTSQMLHRGHMMAEETEQAAKDTVRERMMKAGAKPEEIEAAVKKVGIARDIRSLPLATAKLEDAIAGRTLINAIKDVGKSTGDDTVSIGSNPGEGWFTIPEHPAFYRWQPRMVAQETETIRGAVEKSAETEMNWSKVPAKDDDGNMIFDRVPIYVRSDFEGPLRAVMTTPNGATYQAMMSLKGKTMGLIMYSPAIHNMVEFGRAFPAMPVRIFKAYFDGNRAKQDIGLMKEAIDNGLVPIGHRFFNQDIDSIIEEPNLTPGRSFTSQVAAAVPDLFDPAAGNAVREAIDKAGDFWHNTLLWDRIADLQMGIYTNMQRDLLRNGLDQQTASRVAAHLANRYAGALPQEAMSAGATKVANFLLFSRTFTIGNLGVLKDAFTGLPKDLLAQIERDVGPEAAQTAKSLARRKAQMTVGLDVMLAYAGYQIFQVASNVLLGDSTLSEEAHGYVRRLRDVINNAQENPASMLLPFQIADRLSATAENEPHLQDRIRIGYMQDGTAIYARNPVGKIGEEFRGWLGAPLETLRRKEGTIAGPMLRVFMNDNGFGHHIYDPNAETPAANAQVIWSIVKYFAESQLPITQIGATADLIRGEGDPKYNLLSTVMPLLGVTVRKGAPGGPAVGEMYHARDAHQFAVDQAMPDIQKQIKRGDVEGAREQMTALGIPAGLQRYYIRTGQNPSLRLSPKALRDFYLYGTPEQKERMERLH